MAGSLARRRAVEDWPEELDPSLESARELVDLWFVGQRELDASELPGLASELEFVACELDAGRSLVDATTDRWWRWGVIFEDHRNGLIFIALGLAAVGLLIWWVATSLL